MNRKRPEKLTTAEMENSSKADLTLRFCKKSPLLPVLRDLRDAFVEALSETPLPPGFVPPIAPGKRREQTSWRNAETLIANILQMMARGKSTLAISLRNSDYDATKLSRGIINQIKLAAHDSRALLILKKGFQDHIDQSRSRTARLKPTKRFKELVDSLIVSEDDFASEPHDLINLRRSKTKEVIPRKKWAKELSKKRLNEINAVRICLDWFNLVLHEFEITYLKAEDGKKHFLYPQLYAVYTDDFEHGGRFYTGKGGHQSLTKAERATITFDGHRTVELDFGGLHIRMLYHLAGSDYPLDQDPYGAVLTAMGLDAEKVFEKHPEIRGDLKELLLALVNGTARSREEAANRANHRLFRSWQQVKDRKQRKAERAACKARAKRWVAAGLMSNSERPDAAPVLRAFRTAHKPIRDKFSSGCGLYLQNLDAQIARWVMFEMMVEDEEGKGCVACLPVHDSFITFAACEKQLRKAMTESYEHVMQLVTGRTDRLRIPIKGPSTKNPRQKQKAKLQPS